MKTLAAAADGLAVATACLNQPTHLQNFGQTTHLLTPYPMIRSVGKVPVLMTVGLMSFSANFVGAQTAPATSPAGNEAIKLDPFSVQADSDVGFVAASALAGGRIATPLKDTPVAYSVITKEFLEAFNITDISQAAQFSVSSNYYEGDGSNQGFANGPAQKVRIRGQLANAPTRNFFPSIRRPTVTISTGSTSPVVRTPFSLVRVGPVGLKIR